MKSDPIHESGIDFGRPELLAGANNMPDPRLLLVVLPIAAISVYCTGELFERLHSPPKNYHIDVSHVETLVAEDVANCELKECTLAAAISNTEGTRHFAMVQSDVSETPKYVFLSRSSDGDGFASFKDSVTKAATDGSLKGTICNSSFVTRDQLETHGFDLESVDREYGRVPEKVYTLRWGAHRRSTTLGDITIPFLVMVGFVGFLFLYCQSKVEASTFKKQLRRTETDSAVAVQVAISKQETWRHEW